MARVTSFMDPFSDPTDGGYQAIHGLYALATGGLWGVGLGQQRDKWNLLPHAQSDYIFAIIGEELGFLGCLVVVVLYGVLAYAGYRIARRSADRFVQLASVAITVWLIGQAAMNMGYVVGLLPVTGVQLPLISAGGTSLVLTLFIVGLLARLARSEPAAIEAQRARHAGTAGHPRPAGPRVRRRSGPSPSSRRRTGAGPGGGRGPWCPPAVPVRSRPRRRRATCRPGERRSRRAPGGLRSPVPRGGRRQPRPPACSGGPGEPDEPVNVVLAGGGTGGHIEPMLALADALRRRPRERGPHHLPGHGPRHGDPARARPRLDLRLIPPVPLPREAHPGPAARAGPDVAGGRRHPRAARRARGRRRGRLRRLRGAAGLPRRPARPRAGRGARAERPPGVANRIGARLAAPVAVTVAAPRCTAAEHVGMPLRTAISSLDRSARRTEARAAFGLDADRPTLLVFGGSQGAASLNRAAVARGRCADRRRDPGAARPGAQEHRRDGSGPRPVGSAPYVVVDYLERMDLAYAAADLAAVPVGGGDRRRALRRGAARGLRAAADRQRRAAPQRPAGRRGRRRAAGRGRRPDARLDRAARRAAAHRPGRAGGDAPGTPPRPGVPDADERLADLVLEVARW